MELNAEQIKRALECCASEQYICTQCPIDEKIKDDCECGKVVARNALALITSQEQRIKELTEENERLRVEINKLDALCDEMGVDIDVKLKTIFELEDKLNAEKADVMYFKDQIQADTVRNIFCKLESKLRISFINGDEENAMLIIGYDDYDAIKKEMGVNQDE